MAGDLILIVEDNERSRRLLRDVLQYHGYRTVEAATAEEGLAIARAELPALVLMDIQLPGMNGIEALGVLRADGRTRGIPVIAVTASVMDDQSRLVRAAGFDGLQKKPIRIRELARAVAEAIGSGGPEAKREGTPQ